MEYRLDVIAAAAADASAGGLRPVEAGLHDVRSDAQMAHQVDTMHAAAAAAAHDLGAVMIVIGSCKGTSFDAALPDCHEAVAVAVFVKVTDHQSQMHGALQEDAHCLELRHGQAAGWHASDGCWAAQMGLRHHQS